MTRELSAHIELSRPSTEKGDQFLCQLEGHGDVAQGAASLAIKSNRSGT